MPIVRHLSFVFVAAAAAALAIAPPAAARRTIRLKVPRFVVPPHTDREVCTFVRVPMKKALDLGGSVIVNVGGHGSFTTHHFLMWVYEGKDVDRFPPKGQLVDSKACLDFGPTDTNRRTLIGGAQQPRLKTRLPAGLAQQLKPTVSGGQSVAGIILNSHWINGEDTPQKAAVKITLMAAPKHSVRQFLLDRKSTRLNSSHITTSYAVFCWKQKTHCSSPARSDRGGAGRRPRHAAGPAAPP